MIRVVVLMVSVPLLAGCGSESRPVPPSPIIRNLAPADDGPKTPEPTSENPVVAVAWFTPDELAAGEVAELRVRVRIAPGHHLYLPGAAADAPGIPVSLNLKQSGILIFASDWDLPAGDGNKRLTGDVEIRRKVRVAPRATPGAGDVACDLRYQACTSELCWPPRTLNLVASLVVKP
jgi:hypothetical protein